MNNFIPPVNFTHEGINYQFIKDYIHNKKGERLPSRHYLYRVLNGFDKGKEYPFPLRQLQWMVNGK